MTTEVPQTLEYRGGQLNATPLLKVEKFTNWKKRFICHVIEDTRSSQEYLDDLEEEYQARSLLAKSKGSLKRALIGLAVQKQLAKLNSTNVHKEELKPSKDFKTKYNKVKAKLALPSSSASASKSSMVKKKGLVSKEYEWDEEDVSSDKNDMTKVKVLMALYNDENLMVDKESARNANDTKVSIPGVEKPWLSKAEGFILPNHDTVFSTPLLPLEKLGGTKPVSGPKTIKSILKSNSTFKAKVLKSIIINEPSSTPAKTKTSASKVNSAPAASQKSRWILIKIQEPKTIKTLLSSLHTLWTIISLERESKPRNLQYVIKRCETCGSTVHTITDHYDTEWFKRGEALQAKNAEALKLKKTGSSNANRSKTPTKAMAKELSAASTHECLSIDFILEEEPKKVSEALKHPGWVDARGGNL
nr:hypothetical protein [Tanacetum cinerariifolium]